MSGAGLMLPADDVLVGAALVAASTVGGVLVSRLSSRRPVVSSVAVSVVLLAVVLGDLVPDVWQDLSESGAPWWAAVVAAAVGFAATGALVRRGCACVPRPDEALKVGGAEVAGGTATAVAIGVHRALEGAVLALATSVPVVAALVVHAAGEGFALATLLGRAPRGRAVAWLLIACLSPLVGAIAAAPARLPETVTPIVTALVAGALLRSALLALRLAATRRAALGRLTGRIGSIRVFGQLPGSSVSHSPRAATPSVRMASNEGTVSAPMTLSGRLTPQLTALLAVTGRSRSITGMTATSQPWGTNALPTSTGAVTCSRGLDG